MSDGTAETPGDRVRAARGQGPRSPGTRRRLVAASRRLWIPHAAQCPLLLWLRPFSLFLLLLSPFSPRLFPTVLFSPYVNTEWSQREAQAACGTRHLRLATPQAQGQTLDWLPMGGLLRVAVSHCQAPAGPLGANRRVTWRSPSEES